jgi:hypothetical protein
MTQPTGSQINADLLRPLLLTSWRFYVMIAFFGAFVVAGLVAWLSQVYFGFGISGIRWPVYWGFYITNFVFWIGISHAGTLISAILRLVNAGWRRPVTRCAEAITTFALLIGAMFPLIHIGRPWLAFWLMPEFSLAAGLGFLRDQYLPDWESVVSAVADDSGLCRRSRQYDRLASSHLPDPGARVAGHAKAVASA